MELKNFADMLKLSKSSLAVGVITIINTLPKLIINTVSCKLAILTLDVI